MSTSEVKLSISPDRPAGSLRDVLLVQLTEQTEQLAWCRATAEQLTGQADSDSALERELAETAASKLTVALEETRQAIARLDAGTYGLCEACALPIPVERLEAIPHARRCVSCPAGPTGFLG